MKWFKALPWLIVLGIFGFVWLVIVGIEKQVEQIRANFVHNSVSYEGERFLLYGLEGAGYVNKDRRYPVYYAVYIPEKKYDNLVDELRVSVVDYLETENEYKNKNR